MKKSTLIMILSLVLAVAIGIGSTMAYLQDTDEDVNVMTLGNVYITQNEQERDADGNLVPFTPNKPVYPAVYEGSSIDYADEDKWPVADDPAWKVVKDNPQVVDKFITVTNTGKSDAYVRTLVAFEVGENAVNDPYMHLVCNGNTDGINWDYFWLQGDNGDYHYVIEEGENVGTYAIAVFTHKVALKPGETTQPSVKQIYLDKDATNEVVEAYGEDFKILALSQAVQTQGFEDKNQNGTAADEALNAAFGEVTADKVAEWFGGDFGKNIGSPGDDWINNNPPSFVPEDAKTIANAEELAAALTAGGEYYLTADVELDAASTITIPADVETTLNMNGKTISINDAKASGNSDMFIVKGILNVKEGKIEMEAEVNREWNAMSTVFDVTAGGVLNLDYVTIKHNGGTDMNFVVHLNNWGEATLNMNNCDITTTYCGVRAFNSGYDMNNVTIKNSDFHDGRMFWVHNYTSEGKDDSTLNLDIYNNGNTSDNEKPVRFGFNDSVYYDINGVVIQ